jgi:DNA-binding NarL/FixJ family response regulator
MNKVRILVADDHEVVRRGVRTLLERHPGWEVCAEVANGREAVEKVRELKPDIVVMDLTMPQLNGVEATKQILRTLPDARVIILSVHDSEQLVRQIVDAGACGYVLKSGAGRELVTAVESVAHGQTYFPKIVMQILSRSASPNQRGSAGPASVVEVLTAREREILQLLAEGKSNKEVGTTLCISLATVETHRAHIMRKLDLHTVSELVHYAIRNKIVLP